MNPIKGPECPACGCHDTKLESVHRWAGRESARFACEYCGKLFMIATNGTSQNFDLVPFEHTRCPYCDSRETRTTKTVKGGIYRYHQCHRCGSPFKSTARS